MAGDAVCDDGLTIDLSRMKRVRWARMPAARPPAMGGAVYRKVLAFWFEETEPRQWWAVDPAFDGRLSERFLPLLEQAARGELFAWRARPEGRLAEILILDQFSRNIHRNTPRAFMQDPMALALSQEAVASGALDHLAPMERAFLLMPHMLSESAVVHVEAERLFREWAPADSYVIELRHQAIIDRFGRYPHRNATLGRVSTPEEEAFLQQPGSRF